MCDYSLHGVVSRPARAGEKLVSTKFARSLTGGFAAVNEPKIAVCLLPGTELAFEKEIEFRQGWSFFRRRAAAGTVARFRQVSMDQPDTHHDALELADGQTVLVHSLREGQHATVLQLPTLQQPANGLTSQDVPSDRAAVTKGPAQPPVQRATES